MDLPTYDQYIEPLLRLLVQNPDGMRTKDVYAALAESLGLSDDAKAQLLPSRTQPVYKNRIGWAHDRLKRVGFSSSPKRGLWKITPEGVQFAANHSAPLDQTTITALARVDPDSTVAEPKAPDLSGGSSAAPPAIASPDEQIEQALAALRQSTAQDLLEQIGQSSPTFFEHLVLDVLHSMGYGESREALQHVGKSGDGGIDGVISLDRLGLERVYVQAKRWKNSVGSPEVQTFMGALQVQGANKGVLITSGAISKPAREMAARAQGSVVLVDGDRLASLMMEHGVGVSHQLVKIPKVDSDYFEED
ncbi:restriction endonuclease [Myxococcota bacterium]